MLDIVILIIQLWQKLWDKVWWAIVNILGNTLGVWEHAKKCIKSLGCSRIWNLMWAHMIDNLVCTWWENIENIKIKKCSKTPISSQKEKKLIIGCMLHQLFSKAKFLSPKMCHFSSIRLNASLFDHSQVNHHLLYNFKPWVNHSFGE
jgi:hypothetical protein